MDSKNNKKGLVFVEAVKVRKSKNGLLIFLNHKTAISLNRNYLLKILNSQEPSE